jgi:hypothetical protein
MILVGVTVDALKIRHTTVKASLSATFIDERFNIFQKVYFETEVPRGLYFPQPPRTKITDLEKAVGKFAG